ncbi:P-loop containing nucleoside triphosphate hydrolase protein [Massarina eburnea CBS 473.64]|uniref:P-loop containing nucleoside triphosphate hydrolase protein n=1 Tax=Massarina eburnea CBS 473.64 TaxID=1395130 RepID=A0A6A6SAD4_9PLEO|nr:P-loop containing nucleoside triphosphate hydrolase protein [Massarina eburnea CBS 473.64]
MDEDGNFDADVEDVTNGVKTTTLANGATENDVEPAEDPIDEQCEPGMKTGLKNLYSGKEDRKGRYQWQEELPKNLGGPAENKKTAKWALLVRNVKAYNDPTKVLAIHSIVIQSPLLKKLLAGVLKNYPGITVGLNRLEFSDKFEPLIHRWTELQSAIAELGDETDEERTTKEHAELLQNILVDEFKTLIDTSQDMRNKRVMTYDSLWTLFQPGSFVFSRQDGQETAMTLIDTKYGQDTKTNPCFWVRCKYVEWDGTKFGTQRMNLSIYPYSGTRHIAQLRAFPMEFHPDADALRTRLIERGAKAEVLAGPNYRAYQGIGWRFGNFGTKDKYNVKGRIVIDTHGWNRFNPTYAVFVAPFPHKEIQQGDEEAEEEVDDEDGDDSGMPEDGHFADEEDASRRPPLSADQKLVCTPLLRGYSLKTKDWFNFFVNSVKDIEWQKDAFDRLVLPQNQKELILGFTESQRKYSDTFDDVIEGKGRGMIILLCGPPGVGKTLTAESVAEEMKVPLFMMSAGDLGLDPSKVEAKLQDILEMCTRWHSVLLLDEADVFLEQRSLHELERNKLVSIFLRVLEYFEGTMFLTTNRVNTFDPAFQSRIHISLDYQELSIKSRRTVWKNFLDTSTQEHNVTEDQLDELARMNVNGRQIKNILKIARLLATRKEAKLSHDHIVTTLEVTQHLHNETQFSERTKGTMYG